MFKAHRLAAYLLAEIVTFGCPLALKRMLWERQEKVTVNVVWSYAVLGAEIKQCFGSSETCCVFAIPELRGTRLPLDCVLEAAPGLNEAEFIEHLSHGREGAVAYSLTCEVLGPLRAKY
jgi:hypothetical protein